MREAAFGVRRVDGRRQRVDHLTEAAFAHRLFRSPALGDVLDGQQDPLALSLWVVDAPGVEQHGAAAQLLEVVLDLEIVDAGALCQDFPQQLAQARDVPLSIAQVVDKPADCLAGRDAEGAVEGAIGAFDAQFVIEHQQRLAHGLDRVLGVIACGGGGLLGALLRVDVHQHQHRAVHLVVEGHVGAHAQGIPAAAFVAHLAFLLAHGRR